MKKITCSLCTLLVCLLTVGCGKFSPDGLASTKGLGPIKHPDVNFERPVVFNPSIAFWMWAMGKNTISMWQEAVLEAPLVFNDKPNMNLAPMVVRVSIADHEDENRKVFHEECELGQAQAYTYYGKPTIYICALNKYDMPPFPGEDYRRFAWRGLWSRTAFLVHEAGHGLAGAHHLAAEVPGIMCGWPERDDPSTCFSTLSGLTSGDKDAICPWTSGGGFCDHPVAPRP